MVGYIEELGAELYVLPFLYAEVFRHRTIQRYDAWTKNRIPARVSIMVRSLVYEGGGIEPVARILGSLGQIGIYARCVREAESRRAPRLSAILIGRKRGANRRERQTVLHRKDAAQLPPSQQCVHHSVCITQKMAPLTERQFIKK